MLPLGAEAADVPGLQGISFLGAASELLGSDLLVVNSEGVTEEQKDIDCASRCDDAAGDSSEALSAHRSLLCMLSAQRFECRD